jgi:hypothetical protein
VSYFITEFIYATREYKNNKLQRMSYELLSGFCVKVLPSALKVETYVGR